MDDGLQEAAIPKSHYRDQSHARIYFRWMQLPAWRTLTPHARSLLVEILTWYRPSQPNRFDLSQRRVMDLLNCSNATAAKALHDLEDRGWIEVERVGGLKGKRATRTTVYSLSVFPRDITEAARRGFERWTARGTERCKLLARTTHNLRTNDADSKHALQGRAD